MSLQHHTYVYELYLALLSQQFVAKRMASEKILLPRINVLKSRFNRHKTLLQRIVRMKKATSQ